MEKDEIERVVNANDMQVLCRDALATHSFGYLLPRPYTSGILSVDEIEYNVGLLGRPEKYLMCSSRSCRAV